MASTYKTFLNDDIVTARTLLHEAIPITGSIVYGTYGNDATAGGEKHVKKFSHGMFQSVYDYPYLSSSANHIFDIAYGHHVDSTNATGNTTHTFYKKRRNIYNQMAQILAGHDKDGNIQKFDADGDIISTGTDKYESVIFFNFARLLNKDEIKKGSFEMQLGITEVYRGGAGVDGDASHGEGTNLTDARTMHTQKLTIKDTGAATDYRVNSPAGEYGILKTTADSTASSFAAKSCGLIYYQAGIVVLTTDTFVKYAASTVVDIDAPSTHVSTKGIIAGTGVSQGSCEMFETDADVELTIDGMVQTAAITNDQLLNSIRKRISKLCFNNTTELNSTIYFCRVNHNDFNYSSNPTYLNNSKIRVKTKQDDAPVSYVTSIGLYSSDNELLAVAKLSEPLRKDPTNDMTLRVRLDY